MQQARRASPKRIVQGPRQLWGVDVTLVWVLGILPAFVVGIVDYHGSRVMALRRIWWKSGEQIAAVLERAIAERGPPLRVLTDNEPVFLGEKVQATLARHKIKHTRTRPAHPWTNGRIERLFRTFKETVSELWWLPRSHVQLDRFCADFVPQ